MCVATNQAVYMLQLKSCSIFASRQHKLIHHLKTTGRYHAFKEHLKKAVVNLVRQKFLNEASVEDPDQLQVWSVE